jgi:hypothetical protein
VLVEQNIPIYEYGVSIFFQKKKKIKREKKRRGL